MKNQEVFLIYLNSAHFTMDTPNFYKKLYKFYALLLQYFFDLCVLSTAERYLLVTFLQHYRVSLAKLVVFDIADLLHGNDKGLVAAEKSVRREYLLKLGQIVLCYERFARIGVDIDLSAFFFDVQYAVYIQNTVAALDIDPDLLAFDLVFLLLTSSMTLLRSFL